jgi:hypothetical protein
MKRFAQIYRKQEKEWTNFISVVKKLKEMPIHWPRRLGRGP